jgi:hypothetical protein
MYVLRQQATLMNRPPKQLVGPLAALMARWRTRADQAIGSDAVAAIQRSLEEAANRPLAAADLSPETIEAYGAATVLTIQTKRATWNRWNLMAEAARQTRLLRIVSSSERFAVLQSIVQCAERHSISLNAPDLVSAPVTRVDGESVFTIHNNQIYTSPVILGAESLLLELARDSAGPTIPAPHGVGLSTDKVRALRRIATSGQKREALVGPAGTGKTSLLSALTTSWELAHGEGSVIALAPSSAASTVLSDAIGIPTENIAKWIYESAGLGAEQRRNLTQQTEYAANLAHRDRRKRRHERLSIQLAALHANRDRWTFRANQLVIVDEASMAGTMEMATLARAANTAGAKLLMVGDVAQLSAADTGGAFRLIVRDTEAAELTDVWRFTSSAGTYGGCVFPEMAGWFKLTLSDAAAQVSTKHIFDAQGYLPDHWAALYSNIVGPPIYRMYNPAMATLNRDTACEGFVKQNTDDSCDEYPFAATYQGAYLVGRNRTSVAHVPVLDNSRGGSLYSAFLTTQRMVDGDPFWITFYP